MASEIMTVASATGVFGGGYMDYGRLSREEIIRKTKELAAHEIEKWGKVLATADDEFDVRVVRGIHKQALVERLSPLGDVRQPTSDADGASILVPRPRG